MESICPSRTKSPTPGTELEASKRSKADRGKGRRLARMMLRANEAKTAEKKEERNWLATKSLTPGIKGQLFSKCLFGAFIFLLKMYHLP